MSADPDDRQMPDKNSRMSEELYRVFVTQSSEGIWRLELDEPIPVKLSTDEQIEQAYRDAFLAECNDAMARMYGFEFATEMIGARLGDVMPLENKKNLDYLRNFINSGYRLENAESQEIDRDGNPKVFLNNLIGIIEDGSLQRIWGTQRDITERKQAEKELRESEEKFAKAFNSSPLVLTITSLKTGKLLEVNETFVRVTGYSREEALGSTTSEIGLWDNSADREAELTAVQKAGEIRDLEYIFRLRNGTEIVGLLSAELLEIRGEPCALTVIQDITERKKAAEISERYRLLSMRARDVILFFRPDGQIVDANQVALETYGYEQAELLKMKIHDLRAAETLPSLEEQLIKANNGGGQFETIHQRRDGTKFPVEVTSVGADVGGERLLISIIRDITERRKNEESIRQSAKQLALVSDIAPVFIAHCDLESRFKFVNKAYAERFGLQPEECIGQPIAEVLGEEGIKRISQYVKTVLSGTPVEFEMEVAYPKIGDGYSRGSKSGYSQRSDQLKRKVQGPQAISHAFNRRSCRARCDGSF